MNCCSKSGIREHSPNSQIHNQIFHRIASWFDIWSSWPWRRWLPCIAMCPAIFGGSGPMSLPYSFDFPGRLKNWLRVQGVAPKLYCFGQRVSPFLVSLCNTRSQPQDCRSLLNLLLLDATGLPAAFPLTRQDLHPLVALEKSTLRRMSLVQYSSCCRVSQKLLASPDY